MSKKILTLVATAALLGAAGGAAMAADGPQKRYPVRPVAEQPRMQGGDMTRGSRGGMSDGSRSGMSGDSMTGSGMRYDADREQTRQRAMDWVRQRESGAGQSGTMNRSSMGGRQGTMDPNSMGGRQGTMERTDMNRPQRMRDRTHMKGNMGADGRVGADTGSSMNSRPGMGK